MNTKHQRYKDACVAVWIKLLDEEQVDMGSNPSSGGINFNIKFLNAYPSYTSEVHSLKNHALISKRLRYQ